MREALLDALLSITSALSAPSALGAGDPWRETPIVHTILGVVQRAVRAERAALFLVEPGTGALVLRVLNGQGPDGERIPAGTGFAGWVAHHRETVCVDDAYADPRFYAGLDAATGFRTRAVLAAPLEDATGRVVAVIQLLNKPGGFDADDRTLVEGIGPACAMAIVNTDLVRSLAERNLELDRTQERLRRQNEELVALSELERVLGASRDEGVVLQRALEFLVSRFETRDASALLRGERNHVVAAQPAEDGGPVRLRARRISKQWAEALLVRFDEPALADDAGGAQLSAPIVVEGQRIGALQIRHAPGTGDTGVGLVALVAGVVGRAIGSLREKAVADRDDRLSLVGQMMGGVLHDLRNPLSAIAGYADLMVEESDPDERRYYGERIRTAIDWLESMSQEVLAFSRGTFHLTVAEVRLEVFLADLRQIVEADLSRFPARFLLAGELQGQVRLDPARIRRVLANLARNAGEAGATDVTCRVSRTGHRVVFEIADNGPGIHEEVRDRLFQPFATFGKQGGTGLGLAMAKQIVEAHGGTIEVGADAGAGAVFRIVLPADPGAETPLLG